jgi:hypothetical protein
MPLPCPMGAFSTRYCVLAPAAAYAQASQLTSWRRSNVIVTVGDRSHTLEEGN